MTKNTSRFWDRMATRYSRKPVPDQAAYEKKLKLTRELLSPSSHVLELGCGTGTTALAHAAHADLIHAVDYSQRMIEIARAKAEQAGIRNVHFEQADAESIADRTNRYDMVMAHSLLHLVPNPQEVIQLAFSTLKPGGVFVQNTPILGDTKNFLKPIFAFGHWVGLLPLIQLLNKDKLIADLTKAGFDIEHEWVVDPGDTIFIVAKKPLNNAEGGNHD